MFSKEWTAYFKILVPTLCIFLLTSCLQEAPPTPPPPRPEASINPDPPMPPPRPEASINPDPPDDLPPAMPPRPGPGTTYIEFDFEQLAAFHKWEVSSTDGPCNPLPNYPKICRLIPPAAGPVANITVTIELKPGIPSWTDRFLGMYEKYTYNGVAMPFGGSVTFTNAHIDQLVGNIIQLVAYPGMVVNCTRSPLAYNGENQTTLTTGSKVFVMGVNSEVIDNTDAFANNVGLTFIRDNLVSYSVHNWAVRYPETYDIYRDDELRNALTISNASPSASDSFDLSDLAVNDSTKLQIGYPDPVFELTCTRLPHTGQAP